MNLALLANTALWWSNILAMAYLQFDSNQFGFQLELGFDSASS